MNTYDKTIEELTIKYNSEKSFVLERKKTFEYEIYLVLVGHFPFVTKIRMDFNSIIIYTKSNSQFDNEITVYNNDSHLLSGNESYTPELSVSSLRVKNGDENTLNQMMLVGYLAQEMRNPQSLLFAKFAECSIELDKLDAVSRKTSIEIESIKKDEENRLLKLKKENFETNFKEGNYYIHTHVGRVRTSYKFIKIVKVTPKTATYIITEHIGDYTLESLKNDNYDFKRMKLEESYDILRNFELSTIDDIKECIDSHIAEIEGNKKALES